MTKMIKQIVKAKPKKATSNTVNRRNAAPMLSCAAVYIMLALPACVRTSDEIVAGDLPSEIIGGYPATSPALNHTGSLIIKDENVFEPFCSATLIALQTAVTAKHCVVETAMWGYDIYFGVGPDAYFPDELIPIAALEMAPSDEGGFVGMGQDVAVVHLAYAPAGDIIPAMPMPSSALVVGDRMVSIGYGVFTARDEYDGQRRIGRETVVAKEGSTYEAQLGDFESFVEWWYIGEMTDADYLENVSEADLESFMDIYESTLLINDYETVTGGMEGDSQTCYGDSGGPLMKYVLGNGWQTYGVVSGGLESASSVCDFGTVFATFGPEVISFLEDAQRWEDPCGDIDSAGVCEENVAMSCISDLSEGTRALIEKDCDEINETCVIVDGVADCGTALQSAEQADPAIEPEDLAAELETAIKNSYFNIP
jgi:hypothetical protein